MSKQSGFKKFPFAWRERWLELGRVSPTACYVWDYMWNRSDKNNIFDLEEGLMCKDLGLNRKTLCAARALIAKHGGLRRVFSRNERGQSAVRYEMLGFVKEEQVPEIGTTIPTTKSQKTVPEPSPSLRDVVKRDSTVYTLTVTATPIPEPLNPVDKTQQTDGLTNEQAAGAAVGRSAFPSVGQEGVEVKQEMSAVHQLVWETVWPERTNAPAGESEAFWRCLSQFKDVYAMDTLLRWNHTHEQKEKFVITSFAQLERALDTGKLLQKFERHEGIRDRCKLCKEDAPEPIPSPVSGAKAFLMEED